MQRSCPNRNSFHCSVEKGDFPLLEKNAQRLKSSKLIQISSEVTSNWASLSPKKKKKASRCFFNFLLSRRALRILHPSTSGYLICEVQDDEGDVGHAGLLEVLAAPVPVVQLLRPVLVGAFGNLNGGRKTKNL